MFNNKAGLLVSTYWVVWQHFVLVANFLSQIPSKPMGFINKTCTVVPTQTVLHCGEHGRTKAWQDYHIKAGNYEYESKCIFIV